MTKYFFSENIFSFFYNVGSKNFFVKLKTERSIMVFFCSKLVKAFFLLLSLKRNHAQIFSVKSTLLSRKNGYFSVKTNCNVSPRNEILIRKRVLIGCNFTRNWPIFGRFSYGKSRKKSFSVGRTKSTLGRVAKNRPRLTSNDCKHYSKSIKIAFSK